MKKLIFHNRKESILNKKSYSDVLFLSIIWLFVIIAFVVTLYPLLFVVSASVSDPDAVTKGDMMLLPVGFTLQGYKYLLAYKDIWIGYANSIFYTVVATICNVLVTVMAAYPLSRKDLKYGGILMGLFVFTMYFTGGMIPTYLNYQSYNLLNTRAIIIIAGLVAPYNLIVARTFFANSVPWELQEAAKLDGAGDIKVFRKIVLPLSKPIIAVLTMYYGVNHWNNYFTPMLYLKDREKFPLTIFLKEVLIQGELAATSLENGAITDPRAILELMKLQDTANLLKYAIVMTY